MISSHTVVIIFPTNIQIHATDSAVSSYLERNKESFALFEIQKLLVVFNIAAIKPQGVY